MGDKNDFQNRQAVALTYEPGTTAPTIVAAGRGYVADKIIKTDRKMRFRFMRTASCPIRL